MVGSGILNQAQVFAEAGIAATTVLYAFGMVTVWMGSVVLIEAAHALQLVGAQLDYRVVATITYGQSGGCAADAVIAIGNFAANLSYILLIGSISADLLQDWTGSTGSPFTHAYFTTPVLSFGVIFPLCLVALDDGEPLVLWNWLEMFERAGSVIFALSFAPAALHAYMGLVPCTPEQWRKVVSIAIAVGSVVCYTTGIIGYLSFRGATLGNILENFDGVVSDIASVLLELHDDVARITFTEERIDVTNIVALHAAVNNGPCGHADLAARFQCAVDKFRQLPRMSMFTVPHGSGAAAAGPAHRSLNSAEKPVFAHAARDQLRAISLKGNAATVLAGAGVDGGVKIDDVGNVAPLLLVVEVRTELAAETPKMLS
ncbi:hypothetical protein JKP88DRAFT_286823 [Tribonema minus]|uniref:Amino acid transporter transmembrane domain-containing protein n=1 Tax=Tribonema minus TaxID=303371 RepID=A0A835Z8W9_9STRA|nr:hypothetical protein JKP88DRAFT_286823 [Tribonema minus]